MVKFAPLKFARQRTVINGTAHAYFDNTLNTLAKKPLTLFALLQE